MRQGIEVLIIGEHDAKLLASLREKVEAVGCIVVNVGTTGHIDHDRDLRRIDEMNELLRLTVRIPEPYIEPGQRIGKGQRKANKANRWK